MLAETNIYEPASQMLSAQKGAMAIPLNDEQLQLRMLVDRPQLKHLAIRANRMGCSLVQTQAP